MDYNSINFKAIDIHKVFLDLKNPRSSEEFVSEAEAIKWLCLNELILNLAKDILKHGTNPLELFALMPQGNAYITLEGNRRLCAMKLLNDPDLAPREYRNKYQELAKQWTPVKTILGIEFSSRNDAQIWLDRIHGGKDDGRGRSDWDAAVKSRRTNTSSSRANRLPLALIKYGVDNGLISTSDSDAKLAIVQRFSSNAAFKKKLGITKTDNGFETSLPSEDFNFLLGKTLEDIVTKNYQAHKFSSEAVKNYVQNNLEQIQLSGRGTKPIFDKDNETDNQTTSKQKNSAPKRPASPTKINHSQRIERLLSQLNNYKLITLYYSLTQISAKDHCLLAYVGAWSFLETLTALDGRNASIPFNSYLSNTKLESLGIGRGKELKGVSEAITRILNSGNVTKHDQTAAAFNHQQVINDFQVIENVIIKLVESQVQKTA